MSSRITRVASGMALTLCLGMAFTPLGCGSSQEFPVEPPRQAQQAREEPRAPEATIAQLTACAKKGAAQWPDTHYAIIFDVDVTEDGSASEARVRDSMLPDREMEACMAGVLEAMVVPRSIMAMRSWRRVSGGKVSPESRTYTGDASAVGGIIIELVPIVVAVGVTIIVGVTLHAVGYVADEIAEAVRRRKRRTKVEKDCGEWLVECLENVYQPEWNRGMFGTKKDCGSCYGECVKKEGKWPSVKCPRLVDGPN